MRIFKGWRTIIFNALWPVLPILQMTEWYDIIPPKYLPFYMVAVALLGMWLRKQTTTPLGQRE